MIYLFDRAKKLQKIIPRKHLISGIQTKVLNGIYQLSVEVPLFYEDKKGTQYNYQKSVGKAEFAGHYDDKNKFQMYKVYGRNITANEQGEFLLFDGVHIFFDEAKAMGNIHDRRFRDSEAYAPAQVAFSSIGWTITDFDVTDRADINFYRASVTDAWNKLIETYDVEFDYELQFDGRKIISKNIIMKKKLGRWTGQRHAYGTNLLSLTQEQDESEVYTAAVGRGRGEEAGDGFGPRLEFGDIKWSKDGISKPVGQNYIELPQATAEYGFIENGVVKPRIAPEVVFEDIENPVLLANATYYWLLENCVPKATWKTEIARIGKLELGDSVGVLYKKAEIIKVARVHKIEYNLLDSSRSRLTLGNYDHFKNREMKRINAQIRRVDRDNRALITQLKEEFDRDFNKGVTSLKNQVEQVKIDAYAEVKAKVEAHKELWEQKNTEIDNAIHKIVGTDISLLDTNIIDMRNSLSEEIQKTDGLKTSVSSLINTSEEQSSTLGTMKSDLGVIQQDVSTVKQTATNLRQEFVSMSGTVDGLESWRSEKGAVYDAAADGFRFKVWRDDVLTGGVNFFRNTDFSSLTDIDAWRRLVGQVSRSWSQFALIQNLNFGSFFGLISEVNVEIVKGKTYTVSFLGAHDSGVDTINRVFLLDKDLKSVQNLNQYRKYKYLENPHVTGQFNYGLYYFTFTAEVTQTIGICISATHNGDPNTGGWIRLSEPQFEEGNVPSSYKPPIGEYMHQTDFVIKAGSFLLGNREVGGDVFASGIVGDASGLKLLGENIDVQGNLNVQKSVNAWAVKAVTADIGKVFADVGEFGFVKGKHVEFDTAFIKDFVNKNAFIDNAKIKAGNIRDLTATSIRGGVLSSINNSMKFDLLNNHLEFNRDATIDFYSTQNMIRMFTDSSTSDPRDIIHALGTGISRAGYGQMFLGGGHYDIDGNVKANDIGFSGLKLSGNNSTIAGSKVLVGSGGNISQDQFFEFDFTTSLSNRYAYFKPSNNIDNFILGSSNLWFHSMYTWRLNGLRFYNPSGNVKMGYDNGQGTGASWRFYEDDIWFDRGGTWSMKQVISRANSAHDSINSSNGLLSQIRSLASRVYALENK